jgi:hypothetical protein
MSFDIDMENYGRSTAPAAAEQIVDTNSYQQEEGVDVHQELLDQPKTEKALDSTFNPQAENFRSLREEVDRIKAEREAERLEHKLQLEMLQANISRQVQHNPEPIQKKMFDGMKDDDVPSVSEIRQEFATREAEYVARLEELQVQQQFSDYAEVMNKHLEPLLKEKPYLVRGILAAENKALFAYEIGKLAQQAKSIQSSPPQEQQINRDAQRMVENSRKPGTLSQAGGQAALSKADYFASMSDAEFMKLAGQYLEGI